MCDRMCACWLQSTASSSDGCQRAQVGSDTVVQFIAQTALDIIEGSSKGPLAQQQPSTEALCAREAPVSQTSPHRTQSSSSR